MLLLLCCFAFAQSNLTITVNGDADKFYPVVFSDPAWNDNEATTISIGRANIHTNGSWVGSAVATFTYHTTHGGHGSNFINADISSKILEFFGGWEDATALNNDLNIIIWMRGGGLSYNIRSKSTVVADVYDGVQHALPYAEPAGPNRTYKTSVDAYVRANGATLGKDLLVMGHQVTFGSVAIGTTSTPAKLTVRDEYNGGTLSVGSNANLPAVIGLAPYSSGLGNDFWQLKANNSAQNYRFDLSAGGTSHLSIKYDNGNVGIGTTTPSHKLEVNGDIAMPYTGKFLSVIDPGNHIVLHNGNGIMKFATGNQDRMVINYTGNVGIGTTTPAEKLSVAGNILADKLLLDENGVRLWGLSPVSGNIILHSGDGAGNFGIGTNSPAAKLDVNGAAIITGNGNTLTLKKNSNNIPALFFQGASSYTLIEAGDNFMKTAIGPGGYKTTLLANGNFGIGTETPAEKLSVNGKIRAHEIKVETANWPDYVFDDDYKNAPLTELAQFIKLNRHLPDVPSAKAIAENGVELGEMNKLLLKKIEELTLHQIEKEKEISSVNQKLKIQDHRLHQLEESLNKLLERK